MQAPIGSLADKYDIGPAVLGGVLLYIAAMVVMAMANGIAMLALSGSMLGIACTGSSLAMTAAARASTPERRSFVLGIVSAFSSVGTLVIAPVLQLLLAHWNWRIGVVLFLALTVVMLPFAFMTGYGVQDFPAAYQQLPRLSKPFDLPDLQRALKALG